MMKKTLNKSRKLLKLKNIKDKKFLKTFKKILPQFFSKNKLSHWKIDARSISRSRYKQNDFFKKNYFTILNFKLQKNRITWKKKILNFENSIKIID